MIYNKEWEKCPKCQGTDFSDYGHILHCRGCGEYIESDDHEDAYDYLQDYWREKEKKSEHS